MRTCSFDYYGLCLSRGCFASIERCHSMHWSEDGKSRYPTYAEGTLQVANHMREKYESQEQEFQTRLADVKFYVEAIMRNRNEMDKVYLNADNLLSDVLGKVGEKRTMEVWNENRMLRREIEPKNEALLQAKGTIELACHSCGKAECNDFCNYFSAIAKIEEALGGTENA